MALAGAKHITIAPLLLNELAKTECDDRYAETFPSLFDKEANTEALSLFTFADEAHFRMAMTRRNGGKEEGKLIHAINIFCDMQQSLEDVMRPLCSVDAT
jgi:transaldolase